MSLNEIKYTDLGLYYNNDRLVNDQEIAKLQDLSGGGINQFTADPDTTAWGVVETGYTFVNTTTKEMKRWNGTTFDVIVKTGGNQTSATAPTSPNMGDTYFNTTDSTMYVWDGLSWSPLNGSSVKVDPQDFTADPADYAGFIQIGWKIGGGWVVQTDGTNGLIMAESDEATTLQWKTTNDTTVGTTNFADGAANTAAMIAAGAAAHPAGNACDTKVLHGFSGWYLPSREQFNSVYTFWVSRGRSPIFNLQAAIYWLSNEYTSGDGWTQYFTDGGQRFNVKTNVYRVRACRSF